MMWFGFVFLVVLLTLVSSLFIRKKYAIIADSGIYRPVNNTQKWVERILLLLFLIIIFVFWIRSYDGLPLLLFGFLTVLIGFRAFMEYKYGKEERQYMVNLIWAIGYLVCFISSIFVV